MTRGAGVSIYIAADGGEPDFVASNVGWGDLSRWAESLGDAAPNLRHLCEHGWDEPAGELAKEVGSLPTPDDEAVAGTLAELRSVLGGVPASAAVVVTNGAEPADAG